MNKVIILFLFTVIAVNLNAQTAFFISGDNGKPVAYAMLIGGDSEKHIITDKEGKAEIDIFKYESNILVKAIGYEDTIFSYQKLKEADFKVMLNSKLYGIDQVTVTAMRWKQKTSKTPNKVVSIKKRDIELRNPQTAADLLNVSGKVFIQKSQQGGGSPMIRGFATNRLLYAIDGVRMNTAIFRSGNIQNVISLDPFAMKSTEVMFGPGSIMYGSDAIGGVMSFTTLIPEFNKEGSNVKGSALTRYSSANKEQTAHFDIAVSHNKWAILSSFSTFNYGDLRMGQEGRDEYLCPFYVQTIDSVDKIIANSDPLVQVPTGYSQINLMQKIRFKLNDNWDFQYGWHYSETSDYDRYDRHIRLKKGMPRYGEWYYGPQKWMMNNLLVNYKNNNVFFDQMNLRLAQQSFEESRISRDFNKMEREIRIENVEAYSFNLDFEKHLNRGVFIFYGAEYVLNDVKSKGINENIELKSKDKGPSRYPQSLWMSYAAYLTTQIQLTRSFSLQAGVRYNQSALKAEFDTSFYPFPFIETNLNQSATTGSFGFVFRPVNSWLISANFATAFRSPNVDDLGKVFDSEPGAVVVPNPDLNAEYAYNFDFSIAKTISDYLKIDATVYYTQLKHALVRRDYVLNGLDSIMYDGELSKVQAIQNAATANVYGLQLSFELKTPTGFSLSSDFNYQKGEEEIDDGSKSPSRHAPPWFGITRLAYSQPDFKIQFFAIYNGEKKFNEMPESEISKTYMYATDENGNPFSPKWFTLNFNAMYSFTTMFTISAGIENITDQRYRPYSSGIVAPGRNFVMSLKINF